MKTPCVPHALVLVLVLVLIGRQLDEGGLIIDGDGSNDFIISCGDASRATLDATKSCTF